MNYRDPRTREALAAEYVLGTLHGAARTRFEKLLREDRALRDAVDRWQEELYPAFLDALPERRPPARVWQAIAARTGPAPARPSSSVERTANWALKRHLQFWRGWAAVASAAALALAVYVGIDLMRMQPPLTVDYVAVVNDGEQQPAWLVEVDADYRRVNVQALRQQPLPADRSFELWLLPEQGQNPISVGLVPAQGETVLTLTPELRERLATAAGLAVSLEPAGGSPTGQPTGPVLYQGPLTPPA